MSKVTDISGYRADPHMAGPAKCLACKYEWVAVAPTGVFEFQCPDCGTDRGVFTGSIANGDEYATFTCTVDGCGCEHFNILQHTEGGYWIACCRCGHNHSIDDVF